MMYTKYMQSIIKLVFLIVFIGTGHFLHAWPVKLLILRDKKTQELLCLMGDYHAESAQDQEERKNIAWSTQPLQKLLKSGNVGCLIEYDAEDYETQKKMNVKEELINEELKKQPLIYQLYFDTSFEPTAIITADWREESIKDYLFFFEKIVKPQSKTFYEKMLKKMKEKNLKKLLKSSKELKWYEFMKTFFKEQERKKMKEQGLDKVDAYYNHFLDYMNNRAKNGVNVAQFTTSIKNTIDRIQDAQKYAPDMSKSLSEKLDKFVQDILSANTEIDGFTRESPGVVYDIFNSKKNNDFDQILNVKSRNNLYSLLRHDVVDFGFMVEIKKARTKFPIILVYAGLSHVNAIEKYYTNQENYEVVFEASTGNNTMPSKKEVKKFFDIVQKESNLISKNKENKQNEKFF